MGVDRRTEISYAAYAGIAANGFEGLRMRDVAARAGVNIATVHYYYPSKEDLIAAAYQVLQGRFRASLSPASDPIERLTQHLNQVSQLLINDPELRQVLAEVALRAGRDVELARQVNAAEREWLDLIQGLVQEGSDAGAWAVDVDPAALAVTMVAMLKGICLPGLAAQRPADIEAAVRQQLRWLTGSEPPTSASGGARIPRRNSAS